MERVAGFDGLITCGQISNEETLAWKKKRPSSSYITCLEIGTYRSVCCTSEKFNFLFLSLLYTHIYAPTHMHIMEAKRIEDYLMVNKAN